MHGQDQDWRPRKASTNLAGSVQAIQLRHCDIEQKDVGPQFESQLHGLASILGFAADAPTRLRFKNRSQTLANQGVVVGDENSKVAHLHLGDARRGGNTFGAKWQNGVHCRSLRARAEIEVSVELAHALPHPGYAHADSGFISCAGQQARRQAPALVCNGQLNVIAYAHQFEEGAAAGRVTMDVGQAFLHHSK